MTNRRLFARAFIALALGLWLGASGAVFAADSVPAQWIEPGQSGAFPATGRFANSWGQLGVLSTSGAMEMKGHPFFSPLGENGRACVSCHQPAYAMSVSAASLRERWASTGGKDPVFAAIDGSNCPNLPQDQRSSHSLLLDRGLFRIGLPWPPPGVDGKPMKPEFTLEVLRDPTGCNTDSVYGLKSGSPTVSVYRRPRPAANLKYVIGPERGGTGGGAMFIIKNGLTASVDPETGRPTSMNMMADARLPTLKEQAKDAAVNHLQMHTALTGEQLQKIVDFEGQIYAGQIQSREGGALDEVDGPQALGPKNLAQARNGVLGDNYANPVFAKFEGWQQPRAGESAEQAAFRASVARGNDVFFVRPFWIRDAMHINTVGLGNPMKRTCATCHNMFMTGMDAVAGWMDLGTTNLPHANDSPELPLFKITCNADIPPHTFLGRVIYTQDPGRALISGRCNDVGAIVEQQFRGLAARAPYFSNGSARTLRELVDFYDRRFNIRFTETEKQDLVNFLSVL
ncbi:MAG: hypothetical protein ABI616_10735 [Pseudomonadota bacterium]